MIQEPGVTPTKTRCIPSHVVAVILYRLLSCEQEGNWFSRMEMLAERSFDGFRWLDLARDVVHRYDPGAHLPDGL